MNFFYKAEMIKNLKNVVASKINVLSVLGVRRYKSNALL